jgi:molybdate transport system substrate-binding protein
MLRRFLVVSAVLGLLLAGCAPAAPAAPAKPRAIMVFAASSLTEAFTEIRDAFEAANPGVKVTLSFANSQTLRTQIEAGAAADVFASANTKEMDALVADGLVAAGTPNVFLSNKLVVILPSSNPAAVQQLQDLARPGLKLVLAAEEAPVGNYARQALDKMNANFGADFKTQVLANVVSNEDNVKQVVAKVQLGEADAGIVYTSDAVAAPDLRTIEIPADLNVIAKYPIAPLAGSANSDLAAKFTAQVLSPAGQTILLKWGFSLPK